jgi:glycosyltransferase involved in cell wall biosynthesis
MMRRRLSIAIPTFRRPKALANTLKALDSQIVGQNVNIIIVNNDADNPILKEDIYLCDTGPVIIYNNCCNIGGNANILRCLEHADAEYVWLLADDDELASNAVQIILEDIERWKSVHINYALVGSGRTHTICPVGVESYLNAVGRLHDLWLISNWVFCVDSLRSSMAGAWTALSSYAPHMVLALEMLQRSSACGVLSHRAIVKGHQVHGEDAGWSILNFCLRRGTLLTINLPGPQRRLLRIKMLNVMDFLDHCALVLALRAIRTHDVRDSRELYRLIYETNVRGARSLYLWSKFRGYMLLLYFPRLVRSLGQYKKGRAFVEKLENFDHDFRT